MDSPSFLPTPDEFAEHSAFLRSLARSLVGEEAAEDVVQETWMRALERPPSRPGPLRPWLATVARRLALNARRGRDRSDQRERELPQPENPLPPEEILGRLEWQRTLLEQVLALREPYRTTIYLRYYEGLTPARIAERQAIPAKTVKTRLARALAELRAQLDEGPGGREAWTAGLVAFAVPEAALRGGALVGAGTAAWIGGDLVIKKVMLGVLAMAVAWVIGRSVVGFTRSTEGGVGEVVAAPEAMVPAREREDPTRALPMALSAPPARELLASSGESSEALFGALALRLVRATDGSPCAGVRIDVRCERDPAPRLEYWSEVSDADGTLTFPELYLANLGECEWLLEVHARSGIEPEPRAKSGPLSVDTEDVVLVVETAESDPARLHGKLVKPDGSIPVHSQLTVWAEHGDRGNFVDFDLESGEFTVELGLPGRYVLRAMQGGRTLAEAGPFEVAAGADLEVGRIEIRDLGRVEVTFVGLDDEARAQLIPSLSRPGDWEVPEFQGGVHRSAEIAPGEWMLRLDGSWFVPDTTVDVPAGQTLQLELEVRAAFEVPVRISVDQTEALEAGVFVLIRNEKDDPVRQYGPRSPFQGAQNGFRLWGLTLPAGDYSVEAWTESGLRGSGRLHVDPQIGSPMEQVITLR